MKNRILLKFWWAFMLLGCFTACHEYEMVKYTEQPAINFGTLNSYDGSVEHSAGSLWADYRFTYEDGIQDTLSGVVVVIQGNLEHNPVNVTLITKAVENALMPEIEILRNCYIPSGSYFDSVVMIVKCPDLPDTLYAVDIVFDYGKSNVIAGTAERQAFRIEVYNRVWNSLGITAKQWEETLTPYIGAFSRAKAKFMLDIYGGWGLTMADIAGALDESDAEFLSEKLKAYNDAHPDSPLKDEYGNLVTFEP